MEQNDLDRRVLAAAFALAGERGWSGWNVPQAARRAELPLERVRARFPDRFAVVLRFGAMADQFALAGAMEDGTARDRLFDVLMRRIDFLQQHREGVVALLRALPLDPGTAAFLTLANLRSMAWLLEAAGVEASGLRGMLRTQGLLAVWGAAVRAWMRDNSPDLSDTMAAVDRALTRAEQVEGWMGRRRNAEPVVDPTMEPVAPAAAAEAASGFDGGEDLTSVVPTPLPDEGPAADPRI